MNKKLIKVLALLGFAAVLLTACGSTIRAESTPGISFDPEAAYIVYSQKVYKVNQETGSQVWSYPDDARTTAYASPLVYDGAIYFGDLNNRFHKISTDSPTADDWTFSGAKGWFQAKAATDGEVIIVPCTDRNVYALNMDGTLKWTHKDDFAFIAEPLIIDELVIVSSQDREVLALNKADGTVAWQAPLKGGVIATPLYDEETGLLYIGSLGKDFVAIEAATGTVAWTYDGVISSVWSTPAIVGDELVFSDENGKVISVDPATGMQNWQIDVRGKMMGGLASLGDKQFVVAMEDGTVKVYDIAQQAEIWTRSVDAQVYSAPIVTENRVLLTGIKGDNLAFAFDYNGNLIWSFAPAK